MHVSVKGVIMYCVTLNVVARILSTNHIFGFNQLGFKPVADVEETPVQSTSKGS